MSCSLIVKKPSTSVPVSLSVCIVIEHEMSVLQGPAINLVMRTEMNEN